MDAGPFRYVLVDVDTQHDFIDPAGALYMAGAERIVPNVRSLIEWAADRAAPIVSSADAHVPDDPEFKQFPPHCVAGTWGQRKVEGTLLPDAKVIPPEGDPPSVPEIFLQHRQVVFEKRSLTVFDSPAAAAAFEALDTEQFIVCGVATDYCVKTQVKGLLGRGANVAVVTDAIDAIDKEAGRRILADLEACGVKMTTTDQVVGR